MSQFKDQEELDKQIAVLKAMPTNALIDYLCESWHMYRYITRKADYDAAKNALTAHKLYRVELLKRLDHVN